MNAKFLCPDCLDSGMLRRDLPYNHPDFGTTRALVPCRNLIHLEEQLDRLKDISNLTKTDLAIRLTDIKPAPGNTPMLTACLAMVKNPRGWLYIWGPNGNAKTVALKAMVNEINASRRGPASYMNMSDVLYWIREAFDKHKNEQSLSFLQRLERLKTIKFLALDEVSAINKTDWAEEVLKNFLDTRYEDGINGRTATVFGSNENPNTLPAMLFDRARDGRNKIIFNGAPSSRPAMHWSDEK